VAQQGYIEAAIARSYIDDRLSSPGYGGLYEWTFQGAQTPPTRRSMPCADGPMRNLRGGAGSRSWPSAGAFRGPVCSGKPDPLTRPLASPGLFLQGFREYQARLMRSGA
jgi:hypothetical protein